MINKLGFYQNARQIPSPFCNQRPAGSEISLLVIHCISLPEGCYGGHEIESLFTGCLDSQAHPDFSSLEGLEVSAHCVIRRDGEIEQYVPFEKRAWHAGISCFAGVEKCNDYSIGIELEGTDKSAYTEEQYLSLAALTQKIQQRYPAINKQRIVAHSEIAPGRKTDPGDGFDWVYYFTLLSD
ncbi:1,6-anhydro-N-acetylmuramyl-L-alanine amidase AmpD [Psychromonas sp. MB-3u-54]|uniref:1,6-anhydro-N-acetylmuramyl-L-alanine amidase AmpD n=1 Tax=Psychromonas sp. MB-3u-54 TaxID=2058319 RepID=UPI000C341197|nr:1,6-anhydro-N-acetylmuramyl-L-alanine amidase AmpD [Psychromonas sp. MB-3u-54]PKH04356.1 1,6-anhydro-N-acetylmuramyl-L-alanine amidase AmpD [Psychromonas sp. MB-3u-54]